MHKFTMMKECTFLLLLFVALGSGLVCWNCHNARDMAQCKNKGNIKVCSNDQGMCSTEVRRSGEGRTMINKGCKQGASCMNRMKHNTRMMEKHLDQCNPYSQSSCFCCCDKDRCNMGTYCGPKPKRKFKPKRNRQQQRYKQRKPIKRDPFSNCPQISPVFPHGEVKCHKSLKGKGAICDFKCTEEGYSMFPKHDHTIICKPNGEWNVPKPCCGQKCEKPQYDIIAMAHGGSNETYEKMYALFDFMLKRLARNPGIQHARVDFSGEVTFTQDFLKVAAEPDEHHNSTVKQFHFNTDDGNTNIGIALSSTHDTLSHEESGNRKNVRDVILLAIDSDSDDDYLEAATKWHEEKAMILVLAFPKEGIYPSDHNLAEITQHDHHIYQYKDEYVKEVAYYIAGDLEDHYCINPCGEEHGHGR